MAEESGPGYIIGIATGLILGALGALLLAPKPGGELRQDLASGASKLKDKATDLGGTLGGTIADTAHDLKERSGELVASARSQGSDTGKEAAFYAQDVAESGHSQAEDFTGTNPATNDKTHDVVESV